MNYVIISGSNRSSSQSKKVSEYAAKEINLENPEAKIDLIDLAKENLPLWTEDVWNPDSSQAQNWSQFSEKLTRADAVVVVAAEWAGSIPPSLRNFFVHTGSSELAHKPALIISVSSGRSGTYPISELRAFSAKNNHLLYIPDHVIIRDVENVLNTKITEKNRISDQFIRGKIKRSLEILSLYSKHMKAFRKEAAFTEYPYGM